MTGLLWGAATETASRGWQWKDVLVLLGLFVTGGFTVYTAKLSRRTSTDTAPSDAYTRANNITQSQFERLQAEISELRKTAAEDKARHREELQDRDDRIAKVEQRAERAEQKAERSDRRINQLVAVIQEGGLLVPPPLPDPA